MGQSTKGVRPVFGRDEERFEPSLPCNFLQLTQTKNKGKMKRTSSEWVRLFLEWATALEAANECGQRVYVKYNTYQDGADYFSHDFYLDDMHLKVSSGMDGDEQETVDAISAKVKEYALAASKVVAEEADRVRAEKQNELDRLEKLLNRIRKHL